MRLRASGGAHPPATDDDDVHWSLSLGRSRWSVAERCRPHRGGQPEPHPNQARPRRRRCASAVVYSASKRVLVGTPIASSEEHQQRLLKKVALPVFASDAISSTAYATQEILIVLIAGRWASPPLSYLVPIAVVVVRAAGVVITSYRQTICAYPGGGGTYIVSRENLGTMPSLVAGASILVDYVLTVAVSVAGGRGRHHLGVPGLARYRVPLCLAFVALMTVANLRGLKESGTIFAPPTYIYVADRSSPLIVVRPATATTPATSADPARHETAIHELTGGAAAHRARRDGAAAGVLVRCRRPDRRRGDRRRRARVPEAREQERRPHPRRRWRSSSARPSSACRCSPTTCSPIGRRGARRLLLDPRRSGLRRGHRPLLRPAVLDVRHPDPGRQHRLRRLPPAVARSSPGTSFLPHQFANRGDRLVFSNGIVVLAAMASVLDRRLRRRHDGPDPALRGRRLHRLHAQPGRHGRAPPPRSSSRAGSGGWSSTPSARWPPASCSSSSWSRSSRSGAWMPAVVIPAIVVLLQGHRPALRAACATRSGSPTAGVPGATPTRVVVLVGQPEQGHVAGHLRTPARWRPTGSSRSASSPTTRRRTPSPSSGRSTTSRSSSTPCSRPTANLTRPMLRFLDELDAESRDDIITVVIPEFVVNRWYLQILHNQTALALKARLLFRPNTVVTSVPIHIGETRRRSECDGRPVPRCCRPPCTRRPSGSWSASPSPRRRSTTSGSGSSSPCRSSPRTPSPRRRTRPTRSWSSSSSRPGSARRPGSTWCRSRSSSASCWRSSSSATARRSTPTRAGGGVVHRQPGEPRRRSRRSSPASSLLVDYILTVAVSVAGGVLAIRSAFGFDEPVDGARSACCCVVADDAWPTCAA